MNTYADVLVASDFAIDLGLDRLAHALQERTRRPSSPAVAEVFRSTSRTAVRRVVAYSRAGPTAVSWSGARWYFCWYSCTTTRREREPDRHHSQTRSFSR